MTKFSNNVVSAVGKFWIPLFHFPGLMIQSSIFASCYYFLPYDLYIFCLQLLLSQIPIVWHSET